MSVRAGSDLLTLPRAEGLVKEVREEDQYLSTFSPRHKPWDTHRGEADDVTDVYASSPNVRHHRYAARVENCSQVLGFSHNPCATKKNKLKLTNAWFCRVRHCPVCQWRRSLMWQAKVYRALPLLLKDFPHCKFLFLTLTIRNCPIGQLRQALDLMRRAWVRLTQLRQFPARGWVRSVEVTRSARDRTAHPHYHCLLMVPPAYFQADYLKQEQWAELWQQCLRVDYRPVVDIRTVKPALEPNSWRVNEPPKHLWGAVAEILKYAVKPSDMVRDPEWFLALVDQMHQTKTVAVGGILKHYIKEREREDLTSEPGEGDAVEEAARLYFGWKQEVRRYRKLRG